MGWVPDSPAPDTTSIAPPAKGKWVKDDFYGGPTEMRAAHPYVEAGEKVGEVAAFGGGAMLGGPVGAAVAGTGDEVLNALINHYVSGRKIDISPSNIEKSATANVVGSYGGEIAGPVISKGVGGIAGKLSGSESLGAAAKDAAEKGATAESDFDYARQQAQNEASKQIGGLHEKVAQKVAPEARSAQIQSDIGRTPEQTQAALAGTMEKTPEGVSLPGPGMIGRQQDFWHSVYDPIHKMSEAGGKQYDAFWQSHLKDPVDAAPLGAAALDEKNYAASQGISYSPAIQKLLGRAQEMGAGGQIPDIEVLGSNLRDLAEKDPEMARKYAQQLGLVGKGSSGSTVAQLRGLRTDAANLVASSANGRDRAAAQNIVNAVDDTLDKSKILSPKEQQTLQGLNNKWRSYKTIFDRSLLRKLSTSAEPVDAAAEIFNDPKRSSLILANADKNQLSTLRRTYADWVNRDGDKVIKPEHAVALAKLFPGTPLANPKSWLYLDSKLAKFQDVVNSSPAIRQRFMQEYQSQLQDIQTNAAQQIVDAAEKQAGHMGTFGQNLITQIRNAPDPISAANIATKGMTGLDTQAAIQSIREGNMKGNKTLNWIMSKWPLYAAFTGIEMGMGRTPSPYIAGMAGLGAGASALGSTRSIYLKYLASHPESANALWDAVNGMGTPSGFRKFARIAVNAGVADAVATGIKAETGTTMEPDEGAGEGVKALETSHAEHLAPTPSASDRAVKVNKDLSKGKTPDVHKDLNRGRLSMDETNKLLNHASATDPMAMVSGMPLSEALDAVQVADAGERKTLLPLVEQRLRAEMPKIQNKTLQMNLAKRFQQIKSMPAEMEG